MSIDMDRLADADGAARSGELCLRASEDETSDEAALLRAVQAIGWTLQAIFELERGAFPRRDADG
jgi:hypothetical protein